MDTAIAEPARAEDIKGYVDHLGADGASGWLCDLACHNRRLSVEILFDGIVMAKVMAESFRPDILELGMSDGYSGFGLTFPEEWFDGTEHDVVLRVAETGEPLTERSTKVSFPRKSEATSIHGRLEHVDSTLFVTGWALSGVGEAACVQVSVNGSVVASQEACLARPDLIVAGFPFGRAGFKINIPEDMITRLENEIAVTVDGQPLPGSPMRLNLSRLLDVRVEEPKHGKIYIKVDGWPGKALRGRLFLDGLAIEDVDLHRPQRQARQCLEGVWTMSETLQDGRPHVYSFEIADGETVVRSDSVILSYPQYLVHIDHADTATISGWAFRKDSALPLALAIYLEDGLVGEARASMPRPDIQQQYELKSPACGFSIKLDAAACDSACSLLMRDSQTGIAIAEVSVAHSHEALTEISTGLARVMAGASKAQLRAVLAPLAIASTDEAGFHFRTLPKPRRSKAVEGVDVVIPVYGGCMETAECLDSVLRARNETPFRVVVVNDCSPDPLINDFIDAVQKRQHDNLVIIRRTRNGGFSQAVNLGMVAAGDRDVILLNADTVVQDGWIDRLMSAAKSDPMIGTVTPLSNNGEIVTLPYPCKSLPVEDAALARRVDRVAAQCNAGRVVDLPVAIGFCMFIRRDCLDEIGLFDAAVWGRGYGEEVDFCIKARAQGWRHVVATDIFVVHRGNASFGDEKLERITESAQKITESFPFYDQLIQRFIARDPIGPARRTINLELITAALGENRILHVSHSFGGGTDKYVRDVSALQIEEGRVPLVLRFDAKGHAELEADLSGTDLAGFFSERHVERYAAGDLEALKADIGRLRIRRFHLHAPFGMPLGLLDWLTTSLPFDATIHDYAWLCPRATLTQAGGRYCGEPAVQHCDNCIALYSAHPGLREALRDSEESVAAYRQNMGALLGRAEQVYAGAEDVVKRLRAHGVEANYHVTPHPEPEMAPHPEALPLARPAVDGQLRVALFGAISDIKGFHQLIDCARYAQERALPITFIVFGYTMDDELAKGFANIIVTGRYEEHELDELVREYQPHISFFPNQWPETYSYSLSHSLRLGLWPVVTDIGAPAERLRQMNVGNIMDINYPNALMIEFIMNCIAQKIKLYK